MIGHVNRVAVLNRHKTDVSCRRGSQWQRQEDGWQISWKMTLRVGHVWVQGR